MSILFLNNHFYEKIGKKGEPVCIDDEIPFDIPESWEWCRLSTVNNIFTGNSINKTEKERKFTGLTEGYNYIATKDVKFDSTSSDVPTEVKSAAFALKDGEISAEPIAVTDASTYQTSYYVVKMVKTQAKGNDMDKYKKTLKKIATDNKLNDSTFVTKTIGEELKKANVKIKDKTFADVLSTYIDATKTSSSSKTKSSKSETKESSSSSKEETKESSTSTSESK